MDYLLSVFFNSNTSDAKLPPPQISKILEKFPELKDLCDYDFYGPWKWHWRQSEGPGWYETGNMTHPAHSEEAALGKLTLRVWNRDAEVKRILKADVLVCVTDTSGQDPHPKVNSIFSAFKYGGKNLVPIDDSFLGCYRRVPVLCDVPGGKESNADYGDQRMRSWDIGEFYFSQCPHKKYNFVVSLWVEFFQPERRIFVIDPEMDVGIATTVIE